MLRRTSILIFMRFVGRLLLTVLTFAIVGCSLDCVGMTTPKQAMQCCNSMRCHSRGHHGQDCCKSMASIHPAPSAMGEKEAPCTADGCPRAGGMHAILGQYCFSSRASADPALAQPATAQSTAFSPTAPG